MIKLLLFGLVCFPLLLHFLTFVMAISMACASSQARDQTCAIAMTMLHPPPLFFFFAFLGMHLQHMEVPRLGVESEL